VKHDTLYDVVGVGVGPANLSLAALLQPLPEVKALFLEARDDFEWHPGLLMHGSTLQSPYLKDLVTLVDPCNPYSFFNFLVKSRRAYRFLVANPPAVSRHEYAAYYKWAAHALPSVRFSSPVRSVRWEDGCFSIETPGGTVRGRHLVLGSGAQPFVPPHLKGLLGPRAFHATNFLSREADLAGKSVAVVGGGQTGAEIVQRLLGPRDNGPTHVTWISRRPNFSPLDESPFANEFFTPAYADHFYALPPQMRVALNEQQKYASDGVSEALLEQIYRRLYELDFIEGGEPGYALLAGRELVGAEATPAGVRLKLLTDHATEERHADMVVFCTGYKHGLPDYAASFRPLIEHDGSGAPLVRKDFSLAWAGEKSNRIFVHGMARNVRGVAEPNLGLMSWRSANMINALLNRPVYDLATVPSAVSWPTGPQPPAPAATTAVAPEPVQQHYPAGTAAGSASKGALSGAPGTA
jgi:lysine N6-hydroxylase